MSEEVVEHALREILLANRVPHSRPPKVVQIQIKREVWRPFLRAGGTDRRFVELFDKVSAELGAPAA